MTEHLNFISSVYFFCLFICLLDTSRSVWRNEKKKKIAFRNNIVLCQNFKVSELFFLSIFVNMKSIMFLKCVFHLVYPLVSFVILACYIQMFSSCTRLPAIVLDSRVSDAPTTSFSDFRCSPWQVWFPPVFHFTRDPLPVLFCHFSSAFHLACRYLSCHGIY